MLITFLLSKTGDKMKSDKKDSSQKIISDEVTLLGDVEICGKKYTAGDKVKVTQGQKQSLERLELI